MKISTAAIAAAAAKVGTRRVPPARAPVPAHPASTPRRLAESTASCDAAFMMCLLADACRSCFATLQDNEVDWANVVPDTPCQDVLGFLVAGGHCAEVRAGGSDAEDTFCASFDACIVWEDDAAATPMGDEGAEADGAVDCASLDECAFPGLHEHFLGDGVCHDALPGCYNSKACNYDGGDCCEDTCHYPSRGGDGKGDDYGACGAEGFACADPTSSNCQPTIARLYQDFCEGSEGDVAEDADTATEAVTCKASDEVAYRIVQYDSWGDGWDNTRLTLTEHGGLSSDEPIYQGGLEFGAQGTVHVCLKREPRCYHVIVENAVWGNEISWELRPLAGGAPAIAAGGSPSDCAVALGGAVDDCPNDCEATRPDTRISDPNYSSYKKMEGCIEEKCLIQVGNCQQDDSCVDCMQESTPDYCYANVNFSVLIDCSMCSCQDERPEYCDALKSGAAAASMRGSTEATHKGKLDKASALVPMDGSATGGTAVCGPDQTMKGTGALLQFSQCADFNQMNAMLTSFDNDHFGRLDRFESCAHQYQDESSGKDPMDCMKILHNMVTKPKEDGGPANAVTNAISNLAHNLYHRGEDFCECATKTNKETPTCTSFVNFKTLLFEAVDACRALDTIDCAAWEGFYGPCKKNLLQMFDEIDFENKEQCDFVEDMCGGAGPFPAFRRLDCGSEIAKPAWDFHTMYSRGCKTVTEASPQSATPPSSPASASASRPVPAPANVPLPHPRHNNRPTPFAQEKKQYKPYNANGASDEKKPYFSEPTFDGSDSASESKSRKHHFFRNTLIFLALAGTGLVVWKKRRENFDYARFRQMRERRNPGGGLASGAGAGGLGEYTGVSVSDSCTFEPPSLPPTSI